MRIKLQKNLWLNGDRYCCWITMEKESRSAKRSLITENISGYHTSIESLVKAVIDKEIMSKRDTKSIKELSEAVNNLKDEIRTAVEHIEKEFKTIRSNS